MQRLCELLRVIKSLRPAGMLELAGSLQTGPSMKPVLCCGPRGVKDIDITGD